MAYGADGKLKFSREYFLVFERKEAIETLEMKYIFAKEQSTTYKVGGLELIAEKACFVCKFNFLPRQSWKQYDEFLRIFQAFPGTLGKI